MTHRMDVQSPVRFFGKADAIIADAQPELVFLIFEFSDVAFAGCNESMKSGEDSHGSIAIKPADVEPRVLRPEDGSHA